MYGDLFGSPEIAAEEKDGRIVAVHVLRGAPCGATWEAAENVIGLPTEEALVNIGLQTQFFCTADPAGWDPMYGKSPVHFAGEIPQDGPEKGPATGGQDLRECECGKVPESKKLKQGLWLSMRKC